MNNANIDCEHMPSIIICFYQKVTSPYVCFYWYWIIKVAILVVMVLLTGMAPLPPVTIPLPLTGPLRPGARPPSIRPDEGFSAPIPNMLSHILLILVLVLVLFSILVLVFSAEEWERRIGLTYVVVHLDVDVQVWPCCVGFTWDNENEELRSIEDS